MFELSLVGCINFFLHILAKIINFLEWNTVLIEIEKKEDLFANLPGDIKRDILGRLSLVTVLKCRYVCTSWRDLIEGVEFATLYFPKPGLAFSSFEAYQVRGVKTKLFFDFCMVHSFNKKPYNDISCSVVIDSVNGLILVKDKCPNLLYVCNPITLEYVELPFQPTRDGIFGFGLNKLSEQYKILYGGRSMSCHVCTLGEESWRSISKAAPGVPLLNYDIAAFLNGNLHWLASDVEEENTCICCFDLETELFTSYSLPPRAYGSDILCGYRLSVLEGRLCLCDTYNSDNFVIWLMNSCGDENSWVKEYTFRKPIDGGIIWQSANDLGQRVWPLRVLENGDLLSLFYNTNSIVFTYSKKTEHLEPLGFVFRSPYNFSNIAIYTPSFRSLKAMGIHNVGSLTSLYHYSPFSVFERRRQWLSKIANRVPKLSCFGIW